MRGAAAWRLTGPGSAETPACRTGAEVPTDRRAPEMKYLLAESR